MKHCTQEPPLLTSVDGRQQLLNGYRDGLLHDSMRFWFPRSIDRELGGYLHCLDRTGELIDSDKSVWAQGRMTWMLLTLYNKMEKRPEWLAWASEGLKFLERYCFDESGRMYFHVTRDGRPIRQRRYAYSESFAAIAYAAHFHATGDPHSANRARELFELFVRYNFTPDCMLPKYTNVRPMLGLAPRMITMVTAQELRLNLGDEAMFTEWIDRCMLEIRTLFVKPELKVVMESVAVNGDILDHFDGRLLNPGHAIEGAWFIMHEGQHRGDPTLIQMGCDMLDWMWDRGWDQEYGGLYYFCDLDGKPVQEYWHDMKFWWPHDEAIIATLMAYELTGQHKYACMHQMVHDWSYQHFADPEYGEWYGYLHRDGSPSSTCKGNLWKSFFHHPRMLYTTATWLSSHA